MTTLSVDALKSTLQSFAGQEFEATPYWDDKESRSLYDRLVAELSHAGWKPIAPLTAQFLFPGVTGIVVYAHPEATELTRVAADSLASALITMGIASVRRALGGPTTNRISELNRNALY